MIDFNEELFADDAPVATSERVSSARQLLWDDAYAIASEVLAERERMHILEWGERYYELPDTSAVRGKFRAPELLKDIFGSLENPLVRRVVVAKGSQLFITTIAQIWTGWTMHQSPAAISSVWPDNPALKKFALTRIKPMIETCEPLMQIFGNSERRESDNSIKHKAGPGFTYALRSAGSLSDMKSDSAERMHVSEVDDLDPNLKDQGDSLDLARRALRTYWNSKEFLECTPTKWGRSRVWNELGDSSWKERYVPCPHCNAEQVLCWRDNMDAEEYDGTGFKRFTYEVDSAGRVVPGSTHYICKFCAAIIDEKWKVPMIDAGAWRARFPDRVDVDGYHVPSFYSTIPGYGWDYCADLGERATRNPLTRRVFVNTICALPDRGGIEAADEHFLRSRAIDYETPIPDGVMLLTAFVDVQGHWLEALVVGWGAGEEAWVIEWKRFERDPGLPSTWSLDGELATYLNTAFVGVNGSNHMIRACAIDAGYQGSKVKKFCASFKSMIGMRPIHTIGRDGRNRPIIEQPQSGARKRRRSKNPSWILGTDTVKDLLAGRLRTLQPGPEYVNFTTSLPGAFYSQLTSEELQTDYRNGRPYERWVLPEGRRNEALDLFVGCIAALHSMGGRIIRDLAKLTQLPQRQRRAAPTPALPPSTETPVVHSPAPRVVHKSSGRRRLRVHSPGIF